MLLEFFARLLYLIPKSPKTVQISITNKCNFNCPMCQRFDLKVSLTKMPFALFEQIINKLPNSVKFIILTGWGEPLTHPNLVQMIQFAKAKGLNVRFTTNGALLTPQLAEQLIDSGLDAITFSIDSIKSKDKLLGHPISTQLENIKQLAQLTCLPETLVCHPEPHFIDVPLSALRIQGSRRVEGRHEKPILKIYTQSVIQKNNEQNILDIVDFALQNNLSRIRLTRLDTRFHNFDRPTFAEEKALIKKIEQRLKGSSVGLDFLPHIAFDGLAKFIYKLTYRFLHRGGKYCLRTFNDVYIEVDGKVSPCCALPTLALGDILTEDLILIWNNQNFKNFRRQQKHICGKCDILKIKTFN